MLVRIGLSLGLLVGVMLGIMMMGLYNYAGHVHHSVRPVQPI